MASLVQAVVKVEVVALGEGSQRWQVESQEVVGVAVVVTDEVVREGGVLAVVVLVAVAMGVEALVAAAKAKANLAAKATEGGGAGTAVAMAVVAAPGVRRKEEQVGRSAVVAMVKAVLVSAAVVKEALVEEALVEAVRAGAA